jgi:hypothetical protein
MDRKRIVADEHRFRRGQLNQAANVASGALTNEQLNEIGDENVVYPWEVREKLSYRQVKDLITKKPHHQDRREMLISMREE